MTEYMIYYVYILVCSDESYYVGITNNIERRVYEHNEGIEKGYTSQRRPVKLIYFQEFKNVEESIAFEKQIKGWSRAKKKALIDKDINLLKKLSNRHPSSGFRQRRTGRVTYYLFKFIMIKSIHTDKAPKVVGPYSQAVSIGDWIFCSGQIGIDPKSGELASGIEKQTAQALENLQAVLKVAGSDVKSVLKTTIFMTDMNHYTMVNEMYGQVFKDHKPARSTVAVATLPKGALIEIEATAIAHFEEEESGCVCGGNCGCGGH